MPGIEEQLYSLGRLDSLSRANTPVHRLNPRVKVLLTLAFVTIVASYGRYTITQLLPFAAYPFLLAAVADLPIRFILRRLIIISPFAVAVGVFNPLFDREVLVTLGGIGIPGGWISFVSVLIRFALCSSVALVLLATTGFYRICSTLQSLRVPPILTVQLLLLYRYIFVLVNEALRMVHARRLRSFGRRGENLKNTGTLVASLLARTLHRSKRIHEAMSARGLALALPSLQDQVTTVADVLVFVIVLSLMVLLRLFDVSSLVGRLVTGGPG